MVDDGEYERQVFDRARRLRDEFARKITRPQVEEGEREARKWEAAEAQREVISLVLFRIASVPRAQEHERARHSRPGRHELIGPPASCGLRGMSGQDGRGQ